MLVALVALLCTTGGCGRPPAQEPEKTEDPVIPAPRPARGSLFSQVREPPPPPPPPPKPHYDPERLSRAALVRPWESTRVEGLGIDCYLKTRWKDGKLQLRVALMGPKQSLETFTPRCRQFRVKFKDAAGDPITEYALPPSQFKWAPPTVNNGIPTLEFESAVECPLEVYEASQHWMFYWDWAY